MGERLIRGAFLQALAALAEECGAAEPQRVAAEVFDRYRTLPVTVETTDRIIADVRAWSNDR